MQDKTFVDTNIWLYAFMDNNNKKEVANQIILKNNAILSTQVINEICINLIKKAEYSETENIEPLRLKQSYSLGTTLQEIMEININLP